MHCKAYRIYFPLHSIVAGKAPNDKGRCGWWDCWWYSEKYSLWLTSNHREKGRLGQQPNPSAWVSDLLASSIISCAPGGIRFSGVKHNNQPPRPPSNSRRVTCCCRSKARKTDTQNHNRKTKRNKRKQTQREAKLHPYIPPHQNQNSRGKRVSKKKKLKAGQKKFKLTSTQDSLMMSKHHQQIIQNRSKAARWIYLSPKQNQAIQQAKTKPNNRPLKEDTSSITGWKTHISALMVGDTS